MQAPDSGGRDGDRRRLRDDAGDVDQEALRAALAEGGLSLDDDRGPTSDDDGMPTSDDDRGPTSDEEGRPTSDDDRGPTGESDRGQSLYDWWSRHPRVYAAVMDLAAPLFETAFDALDASAGEVVCDLGSGHGRNFQRLAAATSGADATDPRGAVVGVDYSEGMVARARDRVHDAGWEHVHVARGDATETVGPDDTYDAVFTTFALHTMEDPHAVLGNVRDALAPGGRFVALDGGGLRARGTRWLNPLFERALALTVDHQIGVDTLGAARDVFDSVNVVDTFDAGSGYVIVAEPSE